MNNSENLSWIWVIEDDSEIRSLLVYFAESEGFRTSEAADLDEAEALVQMAAQGDEKPHAIISDFQLPDGDAEEYLKRCRVSYPESTIVCITASADSGLANRLRRHRIVTLRKPITLSELVTALQIAVK